MLNYPGMLRSEVVVREFVKKIYKKGYALCLRPALWLRKSKIPLNSTIGAGAIVNNCSIGEFCYVGPRVVFNSVTTGNYCSFAPGVQIGGSEHPIDYGSTSFQISEHKAGLRTIIEDDVWIGANAVIRQGVTIGRGAVIGAGSVVLNDVARYAIVVGVPAKEIRKRFSAEVIDKIQKTNFWRLSPQEAKKVLDELTYF